MSPDVDPPSSTGPPDRQTLRLPEQHLATEALVDTTAFTLGTHEPRVLHAYFDTDQYPAATTAARLDIRWFTTGDFSLHYVETGRHPLGMPVGPPPKHAQHASPLPPTSK
jgi:hypothetical protein